jgi:hypothetical protein
VRAPLRVGGGTMDWEIAVDYFRTYTSNTTRTWSYPAYDGYPGHPGPELGLADLPAIALLNAGQRAIVSYYGLSDMLPGLNERLKHPALTGAFQEAGPETLEAIARVYDVVWEIRRPQVGLTKLAKVLHRKRPALLPLYDANIRRCYQKIGNAPVPPDPKRSWPDLIRALLPAMQKDLSEQYAAWQELAALTPTNGPRITPLRAMDMIGWKLGA